MAEELVEKLVSFGLNASLREQTLESLVTEVAEMFLGAWIVEMIYREIDEDYDIN